MTLEAWLAFVAASIVLLLIPGPTILLVIGDSLAHRGKSSWSTVAGVAAGDTTAMAVSLAGAGALLAASATAFTALKILGGGYLIWLGIKSIVQARKAGRVIVPIEARPAGRRFLSAWLVTALNPKSIVFFVAFVPQFIGTHASFASQCAVLLPTFVVLASINAGAYALVARAASTRLTSAKAQRRFGYGGGVVLLGAGLLTLGMKRA